jgi:hypothetical protein
VSEKLAESIAHPVAFGTAMLLMFINWMVLGPPDGAWAWVEHLGADLFVLALMAAVAESSSRVRSAWWSLLPLKGLSPAVGNAAERVRYDVNVVERSHRAAAHLCGFLSAALTFVLSVDPSFPPLLNLTLVLAAFAGSQLVVMRLLRPRTEWALQRVLEEARAGLSEAERVELSEELGLEPE